MIVSATPGAAEAWRMAALRLADLVLLGQAAMAKIVAEEIVAGERVTVTLTKEDGTPVDLHSFKPTDFISTREKEDR